MALVACPQCACSGDNPDCICKGEGWVDESTVAAPAPVAKEKKMNGKKPKE